MGAGLGAGPLFSFAKKWHYDMQRNSTKKYE